MASLSSSDKVLGIGKDNIMKRFLLSLLVLVLAIGLLGAAAFAGYRYGFVQGMMVSSNGNSQAVRPGPGLRANPFGMPMHNFGSNRGFGFDGRGGMMRRGMGFGFGLFPLFGFGLGLLARLLFWGLIIAGIVWLVTRSGWRLTRTAPVAATPTATTTTTTTTVAETPPPAPTSDEENPQP